ncbi:MAG: single-stranded DNA-binding protein [Rhodopila sp.]
MVIFNEKLGELVAKHLKKGSKVFVEGAIRTRKWQDKEGVDRYSTEIQLSPYNGTLTFLDRKSDGGAEPHSDEPAPPPKASEAAAAEEAATTQRRKKARA